jgi:hypothetical protein
MDYLGLISGVAAMRADAAVAMQSPFFSEFF